MNKLKLDETISEILYIKHLKVIIDRLYKEKSLLTEEEHRIIIRECDKRITKCENDWIKRKDLYEKSNNKDERRKKKTSRKNSNRKKHNT